MQPNDDSPSPPNEEILPTTDDNTTSSRENRPTLVDRKEADANKTSVAGKVALLDICVKVTTVVQNASLSLAILCGGLWALRVYYAEGKHISGSDITISAQQFLDTPADKYAILADVAITGSDRRGYEYDFSKSFLSVAKVSLDKHPQVEYTPVDRITPSEVMVLEDGSIGVTEMVGGKVTSYRNTGYSFLIPIPEPATYVLTFAMPVSGAQASYAGNLPDIDRSDPTVLADFTGETKSVYVTVLPKNSDNVANKSLQPT